MAKTDEVRTIVAPLAEDAGAAVYDVTMNADKLVVAVTRRGGIDLETLTEISRELSARLDEDDVIHGSYTLEVTSPGLERTLRTPEHFAGAVGDEVTIRTFPDSGGDRRIRGVLRRADADTVTVALLGDDGTPTGDERVVGIAQVERARTVFTWGGQDKPGKGKSGKKNPGKKNPGKKNPGKKNSGTSTSAAPPKEASAHPDASDDQKAAPR